MSVAPGTDIAVSSRHSSSSSLSSRSMSSVESSVTKLLMSTKHLLQRLTQWSKGQANEKNISDAYVQLGNDFKLVSKHFKHSGLDVADLGDVPMSLRRVLEVALRESPSVETLDRYLPRIREIIVTLLDKLKVKQALLKTMKQEKQLLQQQRISTSSSTTSLASESSTPSVSRVSNSVTPTSQLAQVEGIQQPQQLQQSQPQPQPQPRSQSQSQSQSQPCLLYTSRCV